MKDQIDVLTCIDTLGDADSIRERINGVLELCKEIRPGSGMLFAIPDGADVSQMPGDARVEFLYVPTYKAAAFLITCKVNFGNKFPNDDETRHKFGAVLLACTGRNMRGHGYEALEGLVDCLEILFRSPLKKFLELHDSEYPEFAACVEKSVETLHGIAGGTETSAWGKNNDLVARAKQLISDWENGLYVNA